MNLVRRCAPILRRLPVRSSPIGVRLCGAKLCMGSLKELGAARDDRRFVTVPIVEPTSGFGIDDGTRSSVVQELLSLTIPARSFLERLRRTFLGLLGDR